MSTESPIYTPAHLQRVSSMPTTPMPKVRSQTSMRARPILAVGTSSQAISFLEKPTSLHKTTSVIHPNITPSTAQTFPDGLSPIARHTRTPSTISKRGHTRGPTIDDNSKGDFSGILDLTTLKVTKTEQNSHMDEGGYIMLAHVPRPIHFRRETKRLQTSPNKELDRSNSRILRRPKMPVIEPLPMKELAEIQSSFEKPLKYMQQEVKRYIERIRVLDIADERRLKEGGYNEGRNETAVISREHALKVAGLTEEEKARMSAIDEGDQGFFRKMEAVLMDCLKRMEREERLSQEVEFTEGKWMSLETDRLEWRYCYIDVRGKAPPLRLTIKTGKEVKTLRVLASKKYKKPHKLNSDYEFENKKFMKMYERDRNATAFENPYYYIAICPDESGFISIKVGFGELEIEKKIDVEKKPFERAKTAMKVDPTALVMTPVQMEEFKKEIKEIKRYFRAKQLRLSGGVDRVARNKQTDQYSPERISQQRGERTTKMQEMMMNASQRKIELLEQKQERETALSKKRDVQKALRGIIHENQKQKNMKILVEKNWMTTIALYRLMTRIKQLKLRKDKEREIANRKMLVVATMIKKIRQKQTAKGKDLEERLTLDIRNALQFACLFSNPDIIKETQEKAFMKFIMDIKEAWTIRSKFDAVIDTMKSVQRAWREYARKKEGFKDLMAMLWQKNYEAVFQKLVAGEHNFNLIRLPNARAVFKKISMKDFKNDELAREKFIDNYLIANRARYMKSYDQYDQFMSTVDKAEMKKTKFIEILKARPSIHATIDNKERNKNSAVGRTRMSIMAEIEQNSMKDVESEASSMVIPGKPPKLFVLPDKEELETLLAKAMVNQAIVTLHRGGVANIQVKK